MQLTAQDLWSLRNILIRAVNESHEVLAAALRRAPRKTPSPDQTPPTPAPPLSPKPRLIYPLSEAAVLLGISRAGIYRLIARRQLKAVRIGSRRLIEATEIEALLARARE